MAWIPRNRNLSFWIAVSTAMFLVLLLSFGVYVHSEKQVERVSEQRLNALLLADELRHSSESLTKMARSYIDIGDPMYKRYFFEILDMREGRQASPRNPYHYWDLVVYGAAIPPADAGPVPPLLERVKGAAFGEYESGLLARAKALSDRLVQTEVAAIALYDQGGPDPAQNRRVAHDMLFGEEYRKAKLEIMRPISEFGDLMDARTRASVQQAVRYSDAFRSLFAALALLWFYLLWRSYRALRSVLGGTPAHLHDALARIGYGDFTPVPHEPHEDDDSVLAWIGKTRRRLSDLAQAYEQSEKKYKERSDYLAINNRILQQVSDGVALPEILGELMLQIEVLHPGALCSILLMNEAGDTLLQGAAPSLPDAYNRALARVPVADGVGSCGTAAFRGEPVIVDDIQSHPYWQDFRDLAARAGVNACWSQPFKDREGKVLGTFAIYHRQTAVPSEQEIHLIEDYAKLARLAVARSRLAEELQRTQEIYQLVAENSNDVISVIALPDMKCLYVSPSIERQRGWTPAEFMQLPWLDVLSADMRRRLLETLSPLLERIRKGDTANPVLSLEIDFPHKSGRLLPLEISATVTLNEAGEPTQLISIARDLSERRAAEEAIRKMAFYDRLTNLPNRRLLEDRLRQAIAAAERHCHSMGLLFIDLDKFKPVNDRFGHETGDWLLQQVAERMQHCVRGSDTVARIGGDEFVVLLPQLESPQGAVRVAEKIRRALNDVFLTPVGQTLEISSSIGVVFYPGHASNSRDLLRCGDEAMYRAKRSGRNTVELFSPLETLPSVTAPSPARLDWEPAYASQNAELDREHQQLFQCADELLALISRHGYQDKPAVAKALDGLMALIEAHFAREESLMGNYGYAGMAEHAARHAALLSQASELRRLGELSAIPMAQVVEFVMKELVIGHMQKESSHFMDMLSPHLKGLEAPL